jgi:hypothetical protein
VQRCMSACQMHLMPTKRREAEAGWRNKKLPRTRLCLVVLQRAEPWQPRFSFLDSRNAFTKYITHLEPIFKSNRLCRPESPMGVCFEIGTCKTNLDAESCFMSAVHICPPMPSCALDFLSLSSTEFIFLN